MGDRNFRLSTHVRPERYVFEVTPDRTAKTFTARGHVDLVLDRPERSLVLHGVHLDVTSASIGGAAAQAVVDEVSQTLTFSSGREIPAGPARLEVAWKGIFHPDLRGLYLAGTVGVTQFEAADARRMFPCFDEPAFKAVWELSLVAAKGVAVLSNSQPAREEPRGNARVIHFAPTPRLSSYLVACVVGDLVPTEPIVARQVPIRTWAVPEKAHLAGFAQECASAVLPLLEDYFGVPYVFGKLDQVGIPDFEAGAMENAGCITFREVVLLMDSQKAPLAVQKRVAEVITHELAHQWFGNLVTMQWWDDLWLNEAFATWMAFKIVDQWRPQWRMWDDFENGKATALALDAMQSTHPIRYEVLNADQATENFDAITYEKGGAILRMLEGYLGAEKFRDGIRDYMKKHSYANATADDLWNALGRASQQPIGEVANAWIRQSGHPVIEVKREGNRVQLTQRRFSSDPEAFAKPTEDLWPVPVVLRWADSSGIRETRYLLRERTGQVTLDAQGSVKFVTANRGGAGFYRVQYQPSEIEAITRSVSELAPVERMNIIADTWALFRAGAGQLDTLLNVLMHMGGETDYAVLGEAVGRLDLIERRGATDENRADFRRFVEGLFRPQLTALGYDRAEGDSDARRLQRAAVIRALALVARSPSVVEELSRRYARARAGDAAALDPNLLDVASIAAARAGDVALFDALEKSVPTDPDPASKRRSLIALASFESPALADRVAGLLVSDTVPMQDSVTYATALMSNRAVQGRAWDLIRREWPAVRQKTAAPMLTRRLVEAFGELVARRAEVDAFLTAEAESLAAAPAAVKQTRERLRLDEDVQRRATPALAAWLKETVKKAG
jgi:puromycin-sensitive aminopeptidase